MKIARWGLALLVMTTLGCKAKVGDKCSGAGICDGRDRALLCDSSFKYVSAPCKGPDGCAESPLRCDFRENAHGEPCSDGTEGHPMHCTADKKARVRCSGGKVDRDECGGPRGCYPKSETTMGCERALKVGAACGVDGDWCSDDGKERLVCAAGKLVLGARCRGPNGCKMSDELALCDVSVAELNDECTLSANFSVCSVDRTKLLVCRGGKFELEKACGAGRSCRPSSSDATCVGP